MLLMMGLLACAEPAEPPLILTRPDAVEVRAEGIVSAELRAPGGLPIVRRQVPAPVDALELGVRWSSEEEHSLWLRTESGEQVLTVKPDLRPMRVEVEAPAGQARREVRDGEVVPLTLMDGQPAQVAVAVVPASAGPVGVRVGEASFGRPALGRSERFTALATVGSPVDVMVEAGGSALRFSLAPEAVSADALAANLRLREVVFPADAQGFAELARPAGRVSLPPVALRRVQERFGRMRERWAPWASVGVVLENTGSQPIHLVVRLRILDEAGQPAEAFRPRLREGDDGSGVVRVLARVPAGGEARVALPVWVDEALLGADAAAERRWTRVIDVMPAGAGTTILRDEAPLYASRGSSAASAGLAMALLAGMGGLALLGLRLRRWLDAPSSELMTVALFASLSLVVSALSQLLAMGAAALLGPFGILFTGLIDDAFRTTLLATLLTLRPRAGTAALYTLSGWLLSGLTLGNFGPTDLVLVSGRVFWLELWLGLAGVTRATGWVQGPPAARWARLAIGLGFASLFANAGAMALFATLYRLFYAGWYAALVLGGPGFLYPVLACGWAVSFADALRRIAR